MIPAPAEAGRNISSAVEENKMEETAFTAITIIEMVKQIVESEARSDEDIE